MRRMSKPGLSQLHQRHYPLSTHSCCKFSETFSTTILTIATTIIIAIATSILTIATITITITIATTIISSSAPPP